MVGGYVDGTMVYRLVLIIEARNQPYLYNFVVNILLPQNTFIDTQLAWYIMFECID